MNEMYESDQSINLLDMNDIMSEMGMCLAVSQAKIGKSISVHDAIRSAQV